LQGCFASGTRAAEAALAYKNSNPYWVKLLAYWDQRDAC
jgi:hypothetical protein